MWVAGAGNVISARHEIEQIPEVNSQQSIKRFYGRSYFL
jgi:hypothetical protein